MSTRPTRSFIPAINILELKSRLIKSRFINDSFWALLGNVVGKGLALASGVIVARFLGKAIYGEYGIIRSTLMSIAIFSTFGLGYTATKYVAEYKSSNPEQLHNILRYARNITLFVSGFMALVLFCSATYVSKMVLEAPHLSSPLRLVAVWIVFNAVTATQIGVLAGFGEFRGMAKINTIIGIATFCTSLLFTFYWQLNGALSALLIMQILNWFLNYRLIENCLPPKKVNRVAKDSLKIKEILNYSLPVALQEALFAITGWLTSLLLVKLSTYGELGLYSAAMQWNAIILFVPGILRNVILSHLSEANRNEKRHNKVLHITLLFNLLMTLIPFSLVLIFSRIIESFYGSNFVGFREVLIIAVFTTIFSSMSSVYIQAFMSRSMNWITFFIKIFRCIAVLILGYVFINMGNGLNGAKNLAMSAAIISFIYFLTLSITYKKFVKC